MHNKESTVLGCMQRADKVDQKRVGDLMLGILVFGDGR